MNQTDKVNQNSESTQELQKIDVQAFCVDFLRTLHRMWLKVVMITILVAVAAGFYDDYTYCAYYTASATFTVNIREEQNGVSGTSIKFYDDEAAGQMAKTFPYIITSDVLRNRVMKDLGETKLTGKISANVKENTNLLTISVRDKVPENAYTILQSVLNNYQDISEAVVGKVNMNMLDETGIPTSPDNPKNIKVMAKKGAVGGAALGLAWVFAATLLRRTIRREEDCAKLINQRCLGSVPLVHIKERSKKTNRTLNITRDTISREFKEAFRVIRNKVERSARDNQFKVVLVTSALAGEGKSTIAVNMALSLAMEGKKVALIDCDLRNPSDSEILDVSVDKGLTDYLKGNVDIKDCIHTLRVEHFLEEVKLFFIPGGTMVADGSAYLGKKKMKVMIEELKEQTDYVILDSAPVGLLTDAGLIAQYADGVVFVVKKDFARISHIMDGMEHLAESGVSMIGCVLNGE